MSSGLYTQQPGPPYADQPFNPPYPPVPQTYAAPPRGGSNWILSLLLIGGGVLLIGCVLIVGAVWYAVSSVEGWMVSLGREGIVAVVEESDIPAGEKQEVVAQVDRVVAAYKAHEIGSEDLERLLTGMDDSPLMAYIALYGAQQRYLEGSTLPADEQDALKLAWRRAVFGMFAGEIAPDEFYDALPLDDRFDGALVESDDAGDEILRKWQSRLTKLADDAGAPPNPPEVDIGDEARKLVDELLTR
jgi:hypothetical protein